jgi:hypothetical protein
LTAYLPSLRLVFAYELNFSSESDVTVKC